MRCTFLGIEENTDWVWSWSWSMARLGSLPCLGEFITLDVVWASQDWCWLLLGYGSMGVWEYGSMDIACVNVTSQKASRISHLY